MKAAGVVVCSLQESSVRGSYFNPPGRKVKIETIAGSSPRLELGGTARRRKIANVVDVYRRIGKQCSSHHDPIARAGCARADGKDERSILQLLDPDSRKAFVVGAKG